MASDEENIQICKLFIYPRGGLPPFSNPDAKPADQRRTGLVRTSHEATKAT